MMADTGQIKTDTIKTHQLAQISRFKTLTGSNIKNY